MVPRRAWPECRRRPVAVLGAALVGPNADLTAAPGNHAEAAVAMDPTNADRVFAVSMDDRMTGLDAARSSDGGVTWTRTRVATGGDGLLLACCDPSLSWDSSGNLFLTYINSARLSPPWSRSAPTAAPTFHNPVAVDRLPTSRRRDRPGQRVGHILGAGRHVGRRRPPSPVWARSGRSGCPFPSPTPRASATATSRRGHRAR